MKSKGSCLLLIFWLMLEQVLAQNSSDILLDFLSVFNGNWDNRAGIQAGTTTNLLESKFAPVDIPALRPKTIMYFENALNGKVFSLYLCVVTQDKENPNIIMLTPYNFTDSSKYNRPRSYDLNDLSNVTLDDLTDYKLCTVRFQASGNGVFSGLCPYCNHTLNEGHPKCAMTFSCDSYNLTRPQSSTYNLLDVFYLSGPRYPLINAPDHYVSPCDKRKRNSDNYSSASHKTSTNAAPFQIMQ